MNGKHKIRFKARSVKIPHKNIIKTRFAATKEASLGYRRVSVHAFEKKVNEYVPLEKPCPVHMTHLRHIKLAYLDVFRINAIPYTGRLYR